MKLQNLCLLAIVTLFIADSCAAIPESGRTHRRSASLATPTTVHVPAPTGLKSMPAPSTTDAGHVPPLAADGIRMRPGTSSAPASLACSSMQLVRVSVQHEETEGSDVTSSSAHPELAASAGAVPPQWKSTTGWPQLQDVPEGGMELAVGSAAVGSSLENSSDLAPDDRASASPRDDGFTPAASCSSSPAPRGPECPGAPKVTAKPPLAAPPTPGRVRLDGADPTTTDSQDDVPTFDLKSEGDDTVVARLSATSSRSTAFDAFGVDPNSPSFSTVDED